MKAFGANPAAAERPKLAGTPAAGAVRSQLERILASPEFVGSKRLQNFLRFVVEETLAGRAERIKGYTIALSVFNRDETFDPQTDPIVRIEASRLRRSLERYYFTTGRSDPIRIDIPKGGYIPHFSAPQSEHTAQRTPPQEAAPDRIPGTTSDVRVPETRQTGWPISRREALGLVGGLLAVTIAVIGVAPWPATDDPHSHAVPTTTSEPSMSEPSIIVLPFVEAEGGKVQTAFGRGVTEELISELTRFRELFVYAPNTAFGYDPAINASTLRGELGVDYVLDGSVQRDGERIRIGAQLLDAKTDALVWADTYERDLAAASIFDVQSDIAQRITAEIAQPYGAIAAFDWQRARGRAPESLAAYDCVLQAYDYRRLLALTSLSTVRACLERAVEEEPQYADAWAMLALAYSDDNRFQPLARGSSKDLDRAVYAAERAVALAPESAHAYRALMVALFFQGRVEEAFAAGERALTLNPNSSEVLAEFGLRHVIAGNAGRGLALIRQAMVRNPMPPDWYRVALVLGLYRTGAYDDAVREAARTQPRHSFIYWAILTAVYAHAKKPDEAQQAARELLGIYPDFVENAWAEMAKRNFNSELAARMAEGWRRAGLDVPLVPPSADRDPAPGSTRSG